MTEDEMGSGVGRRRRPVARRAVAAALVTIALAAGAACGSSSTDTGSGEGTSTSAASGSGSGSASGPAGGSGTTQRGSMGSNPGMDETAMMGAVELVVVSTPYGDALGTDDGRVVYTWDEEADGTIRCVDEGCLEVWPPVTATEVGDVGDLDPGRVTLVERPDGTMQLALDGKPLYHMADDGPGEANCQGANGWWIVNPDGTKNTNETTSTATTQVAGY